MSARRTGSRPVASSSSTTRTSSTTRVRRWWRPPIRAASAFAPRRRSRSFAAWATTAAASRCCWRPTASQAISVAGGMTEWMRTVVARELTAPAPLDRLLQFDRIGKGALAYALVCDGQALLLDPPRNTADDRGGGASRRRRDHRHRGHARARGLHQWRPRARVSSRTCRTTCIRATPCLPFDGRAAVVETRPIVDGSRIPIGRAEIDVLHTPGHTEGSVCFRLGDEAVWTGDFIFVRSVGRPDLGGKQAEWTGELWREPRAGARRVAAVHRRVPCTLRERGRAQRRLHRGL